MLLMLKVAIFMANVELSSAVPARPSGNNIFPAALGSIWYRGASTLDLRELDQAAPLSAFYDSCLLKTGAFGDKPTS
jgi:hypothetical protein